MQFAAALAERVGKLCMERCERLLLGAVEFSGMLLEVLVGLCGARKDRFQLLRLFLQRFARRRQLLFPFPSGGFRRFSQNGGVSSGFFLKLSEQRAQVHIQPARRAVLRLNERAFQAFA